jgi:hypothetical protein
MVDGSTATNAATSNDEHIAGWETTGPPSPTLTVDLDGPVGGVGQFWGGVSPLPLPHFRFGVVLRL